MGAIDRWLNDFGGGLGDQNDGRRFFFKFRYASPLTLCCGVHARENDKGVND